jgi:hypothetical protein
MCARCKAIEVEIARFQRLRSGVDDRFALALMSEAVVELQSEKTILHPENKSGH